MDYNSIGRQRGRPSRATGAPGRRTGLVAYHGLRLFGANPPLATNAFKDLSGASDAVTVPTAESPESPESPIDVASPPADSNIASGSADPSGSGLTASASPTSSPAPELAAHIQAIEGTLSFIDRASARLSANASGIRFGNVQKQEQRIRSAMRRIRQLAAEAGAAEAGLIAELDALRRDSSRLASSLTTVGASTASPAPETPLPALEGAPETAMTAVQATRIRQGITRSMVSLATAPLHLRIEFDPQFKDERPDTLLLAARIHALHRLALGTLREIRWVDVNRARLAFGDGREPTFVDAEFDAGGRLQLPETWRQAPSGGAGTRTPARTSPPSPPRAPPRPPTSDEARARRGNAEKAPRVGRRARSRQADLASERTRPRTAGCRAGAAMAKAGRLRLRSARIRRASVAATRVARHPIRERHGRAVRSTRRWRTSCGLRWPNPRKPEVSTAHRCRTRIAPRTPTPQADRVRGRPGRRCRRPRVIGRSHPAFERSVRPARRDGRKRC